MVRAKTKLPKIAIHIFLANVYVRAGDRRLEEMPKALDAVDVMPRAGLVIGPSPFLPAMIYGAARVAVAFE
jgi:hypothetical protein